MTPVASTTRQVAGMHLLGGCGEELLGILKVGGCGGAGEILNRVREGV